MDYNMPPSMITPRSGRPPTRPETPTSRKRRLQQAEAASKAHPTYSNIIHNISSTDSSCHDSFACSSLSDMSSGQLRPAVTTFGGVGMFDGKAGGGGVMTMDDTDDLDNFVQYVQDDDDDSATDRGQEVSVTVGAKANRISFGSDFGDEDSAGGGGRGKGMMRLLRSFRKKKKPQRQSDCPPLNVKSYSTPNLMTPPLHQHDSLQQRQQPRVVTPLSQSLPTRFDRAHSTPVIPAQVDPSSLTFHYDSNHVPQTPAELRYTTTSCAVAGSHHDNSQRSRSLQEDYRTYNEPKSTLPRLGSFELDIDTIPASPRTVSISPFSQEDVQEFVDDGDSEEGLFDKDRGFMEPAHTWRTSASSSKSGTNNLRASGSATAVIPFASGDVELLDDHQNPSDVMLPIHRQDSWNRRLDRNDIFHRHYLPSRQELEELKQLENYLGIFSTTTKHRFAALWRELVPSIDTTASQLNTSITSVNRRRMLQSQLSNSSMSSISSVTGLPPINNHNKNIWYSIVLKRGPIQFEQYKDYHCEWILLTRGFVVARPNFQFIPRFQAGDKWTNVVRVQPTTPLSITLSCTSRSHTMSQHLTITQLKQQQQYGCYTYEISCETPQEQASWLDALRRVVIQAHDSASTNEKEMGGLGWQYRVVYVPFYTEAVTGNPIQKETILAGSTGHVDLNALDSYNSYAPLHYATRANHVRVMRFLLEAGADARIGDGYGRTPMYYAELHQLPESTIHLLESYGAQRSKKASASGIEPKSGICRRRCLILAMVLLLLACAASALLWKFGMLESIGIGGGNEVNANNQNHTGYPQIPNFPQPGIATEYTNRAPSTDETAAPTSLPYIKTAPPSPSSASFTGARADPIPTSAPSQFSTDDVFNTALFRLLESASFDAGAALRQPKSSQQRAFFWLLGNANLDSYTNSKKIQRFALATLYYSTNGDGWADNLWWLSDEDECMWFNKQVTSGYEACATNPRETGERTLTSLDLSFNNVQGTLPPEMGLLSGLLRLDLDGGPAGFLTGSLPNELGYLNLMESFSARGNQLTGTLPPELGSWRMVRGIDLSFNKLSGSIPAAFEPMMWLTELNLEMNQLSGPLPTVPLGRLSNLFKLSLGGNQLTGPIPTEIGLLTKLRYLYLELNQFSSIPTEIGLLVNLNVLSAFENVIRGPIPTEMGGMTTLGSLLLRSNLFHSTIPTQFGLMTKLQNTLDLSFNELTGPIPSDIGSLTLLRSLHLQSNKLNGEIPSQISQLAFLNTFRVETNDIVGTVPSQLCTVFDATFPNFYADCTSEVECACCTYCCTDGGGCACQHANTEDNYLC